MRRLLPLLVTALATISIAHAYTCTLSNLVDNSVVRIGVQAANSLGTGPFANLTSRTFSSAKYVSATASVWAVRTSIRPREGSAPWTGTTRTFDYYSSGTLRVSNCASSTYIDTPVFAGTYVYSAVGKASASYIADTSAVVGAAMTTDYRGYLSSSSVAFGYDTHVIDLDASDGSIYAFDSSSQSIGKYVRSSGLYSFSSTAVTLTGNGITSVSGYNAAVDGVTTFRSLRISSDGASMLVPTATSTGGILRVRVYRKVSGAWTAYAILTQTGGLVVDNAYTVATPDHRVVITNYDDENFLVRTRSGADWSTSYSSYTFATRPAGTASATYTPCSISNAYIDPNGAYASCPIVVYTGTPTYAALAMHTISSAGPWSTFTLSTLTTVINASTYGGYIAASYSPSLSIVSSSYDYGMNTFASVSYVLPDPTQPPATAFLIVAKRVSGSSTWTLSFASTNFATYSTPNLLSDPRFYSPFSIALSGDGRMLAVIGESSMPIAGGLANGLYPASSDGQNGGPVGQSVVLYEVAGLSAAERRWTAPIYTNVAPAGYASGAIVYNAILRALPSGDQFLVVGTDVYTSFGVASIVGPHLPSATARVPSAPAVYDGVAADAFQFAAMDPADGRIYAVAGSTAATSALRVFTRVQNQLLTHAPETVTRTSHGAAYATGAADASGMLRSVAFSEDGSVMAIAMAAPAGDVAARMYRKTACGRWILAALLSCGTGVTGASCFGPTDRLLLSGNGNVVVRISGSSSTGHRIWRTSDGWMTYSAVTGPTLTPYPVSSLQASGMVSGAISYDGKYYVVQTGSGSTLSMTVCSFGGSTWTCGAAKSVITAANFFTGVAANPNFTTIALAGRIASTNGTQVCSLAYNPSVSSWGSTLCASYTVPNNGFAIGIAISSDSYVAALDSSMTVRIIAGTITMKTVSLSGTMDATDGLYNSIAFAPNNVEVIATLRRTSGATSVLVL